VKSIILSTISSVGRLLRRTPLARSKWLNRVHAAVALALHGSKFADVGPFRVRLDPRDRFIAKKIVLYGGYETHEIELLCSLVRPGDHVLDVGANIGLFTLFLSRAVGPTGRVVAVEPDPDNVALLKENAKANRCDNVTVVPCALGTEEGVVNLYQVDENRGNLSLADVGDTGRAVNVTMRRGADVLAELNTRPRVVKIDVEGAEPMVVRGLGYRPPVMLFEFAPSLLERFDFDPQGFLADLTADGYRIESVDPDTGRRQAITPSAALNGFFRSRQASYNILATRDDAESLPAGAGQGNRS